MRVQLLVLFKWNTGLDNFPRCLPFPQFYASKNSVIQNSEKTLPGLLSNFRELILSISN